MSDGIRVCIRDHLSNNVWGKISHNSESTSNKFLRKWTHYAVVFNRKTWKIFLYLNGKKQNSFLDITNVKGDTINHRPLIFGHIHGWKTKGVIDQYCIYNKALIDSEVMTIYNDHNAWNDQFLLGFFLFGKLCGNISNFRDLGAHHYESFGKHKNFYCKEYIL